MKVDSRLIRIFRDDLCKDQREIKVMNVSREYSATGKTMRKFSTSADEFSNEIDVMRYLINAGMDGIPHILSIGEEIGCKYIDIEYYDGIRVYNLLAYLRSIDKEIPELHSKVELMRSTILERCYNRQAKLQVLLKKWADENNKTETYPQAKLFIIVKMLCQIMKLDIDIKKIESELTYISDEFKRDASVPFRDSTTKNMVIYCPELYLGNFVQPGMDTWDADEIRKKKIIEYLSNDKYLALLKCPIIDFDFSTCEHLTTPYDDPIGLTCHEIAFRKIPQAMELVWLDNQVVDNKSIAISYIVRFLRFGGRKIMYHILHPNAYRYRFKYDNENFYFIHLNEIVRHFWHDADKCLPEFIRFIDAVKNFDKSKVIDDVDEFELQYPQCNRKFYIDVFPY